MRLSAGDIAVLKSLQRDGPPAISSTHRLRLEMMGLVRDTSRGLMLTPQGLRASAFGPTVHREHIDTPAKIAGARRRSGDWWA